MPSFLCVLDSKLRSLSSEPTLQPSETPLFHTSLVLAFLSPDSILSALSTLLQSQTRPRQNWVFTWLWRLSGWSTAPVSHTPTPCRRRRKQQSVSAEAEGLGDLLHWEPRKQARTKLASTCSKPPWSIRDRSMIHPTLAPLTGESNG